MLSLSGQVRGVRIGGGLATVRTAINRASSKERLYISRIIIRMLVATTTSIALMSGASTPAAAVVALPAGCWSIPVDVAPAKVDASFSFVTNDCGNQSPIRISGEDSTITLYGSCGEVDISGTANTVNLQTVAIIKAPGTGNHITWEQGPGGAAPQISNPNGSNDIHGPGGITSGRV